MPGTRRRDKDRPRESVMTLWQAGECWLIINELVILALIPAKPFRQTAQRGPQQQHPRAHERDQHNGVGCGDDERGDVEHWGRG